MLYNTITKYQLGDPHGDLYLPSTTKVELCERSENERERNVGGDQCVHYKREIGVNADVSING